MTRKFTGRFGLVPALDIENDEQFESVVRQTTGVEGMAGYKLGLSTVLRLGLTESVRRLRDLTDLPIYYDHQKAGPDMPDSAYHFTQICAAAGVDGLVLFPVAGPTAVEKFVGESIRLGMTPIVGGHIPVPDYVASGGGYMIDDALDEILKDSARVGADNFVLPAHDPELVSRWTQWISGNVSNPVVYLTGFGSLGGKVEEAIPAAMSCERLIAIVGRLITGSKDPADAAKSFVEQMNAAASSGAQ